MNVPLERERERGIWGLLRVNFVAVCEYNSCGGRGVLSVTVEGGKWRGEEVARASAESRKMLEKKIS